MPRPHHSESRQLIANSTHSADRTFEYVERLNRIAGTQHTEEAMGLARRLRSMLSICEEQIRTETSNDR